MNRCIELAKNGLGSTYPNPMVGCVLVADGKIIGEGWHQKSGEPHAEVNAIKSVSNKSLLKKATLYVSLEPCSHFGKTPPCSDLIIASEIPEVVIGSIDPNPVVAGKGIAKLKDAGCHVIQGILEKECNELNKRFFTYHTKKRPYIFLKWAESPEGFIAPLKKSTVAPFWITNAFSKQWVHKQRATEQAILIGGKTLKEDNPALTTREWHGKNPLRVSILKSIDNLEQLHFFDGTSPALIFIKDQESDSEKLRFVRLKEGNSIPKQICEHLYSIGIQSLIVEGGRETLQSFISSDLWDEAFLFKGDTKISEGLKGPNLEAAPVQITHLDNDRLFHFINR